MFSGLSPISRGSRVCAFFGRRRSSSDFTFLTVGGFIVDFGRCAGTGTLAGTLAVSLS